MNEQKTAKEIFDEMSDDEKRAVGIIVGITINDIKKEIFKWYEKYKNSNEVTKEMVKDFIDIFE